MDEIDQFVIGKELAGGWTVTEAYQVQRDARSACRSYLARNGDGAIAYIKMLDPRANGSLEEAQSQLNQFVYESRIAQVCAKRNMRRVIKALTDGTLQTPPPFSLKLNYLIFEWAERDVRSHFEGDEKRHFALLLRWLHHTATALMELHYSDIGHQDVKPANLVVMPDVSAKLGGLSRAFNQLEPRECTISERDISYLAPELLYGEPIRTLNDRFAADMYAFGCCVFFLLSGLSLNVQISRQIDPMHHWSKFRGSFVDALPYVTTAAEEAFIAAVNGLPPELAQRLGDALRELCAVSPSLRGHPANRNGDGSRYGLQRYVSLFDLLARRAEIDLKRAELA